MEISDSNEKWPCAAHRQRYAEPIVTGTDNRYRIIFRISSKGGGVNFNPKVADFVPNLNSN